MCKMPLSSWTLYSTFRTQFSCHCLGRCFLLVLTPSWAGADPDSSWLRLPCWLVLLSVIEIPSCAMSWALTFVECPVNALTCFSQRQCSIPEVLLLRVAIIFTSSPLVRAPNSLYIPISWSEGNRKVVSPKVWLTGGFGDRRTLASSWEPVSPLLRENRKVAYLHEHRVSLLSDILSHTNKPYIEARMLSHHGAGYKSARGPGCLGNTSWRSFQAWKGLSWGDICCSWARWVDCWKQASSCRFQGRELWSQMYNTWHLCAQTESTQTERQLHEMHVWGCVHM